MTRWGQVVGGPKVWARDVAFTASLAVTMALLGPFGSFDQPFEERLVESLAFGFLSGSILVWPLMRLALRAGARAGLPELFTMLVGLVVLAIPVSLTSNLLTRLFDPTAPAPPPMGVYYVILAMILPFGVGYLLLDRRLSRAAALPPAASQAPAKLYDRLPAHLGREVLALQAEDHYVRVHTPVGSALLLIRLADAIEELGAVEGERPHRSWWVARSAIAAARPEGRRMTLTLSNGVEVPVTREAVPRLRRAGWV
jgi:hypothetical protein